MALLIVLNIACIVVFVCILPWFCFLYWFSCLLLIAYLGWGVVLLLVWVIVFRFVCLVLICCA